MLDQVVAFIQEVMVGLEVSLAVELRYQCKAHNGIVPSAQPATSRSAAGMLEGKKSFPRPPAQSLQLKHPPYEEMGTLGRVSHTGTHDGNGKQDNRTLLDAIVNCRDLSKPFTKKE